MTPTRFLLNLDVPPRKAPTKDSLYASPKRIEEWLGTLPMANVGEAGRQLLQALMEVNRLQLPPLQRYRIVEMLRVPARSIGETLEGHYIDVGLPLEEKKRHLVSLAFAFQDAMAAGYELVLLDLQQEKGVTAVRHKSAMGTSVHRAVHHLGHILFLAYQVYYPYPAGVWRRVHQLFRFARARGLDKRGVDDAQRKMKSSATDVYKQILLLSLCSPYRLRQHDLARIYRALEEWAGLCDLTGIEAEAQLSNPQGKFGIPLDGDAGPQPLALVPGRSGTDQLDCILDTAALAHAMRRQYACMTADDGRELPPPSSLPEGIDRELMCQVMTSWRMLVDREFRRRTSDAEVDLTVGVCSVFCRAGNPSDLDAARKSTTVEIGTGTVAAWTGQLVEQNDEGIYRCRLADESERGCRLRWPTDAHSKARVGELLGIRRLEEDKGLLWSIGVVRWMRNETGGSLQVGVELLAPLAKGLPVRLCDAEGKCGDYQYGLLLPPLDSAHWFETLLLPTCDAETVSRARLWEAGRERVIELTGLLESSNAFSRFRFRYLPMPVEKTPSDWTPGRWNAQDFERVWRHL
jgi:hypothetical protein